MPVGQIGRRLATDEVLKLMADKGVYVDPNVGVVLQNYLSNKAHYLGIGNYNEEGFAYMEKGLALNAAMIKKAVATPNLHMVLGTDAVAGAHGHNANELVARVRQGNQKPMDAIISATSMSAKSMRLEKTIARSRPLRGGSRLTRSHHRHRRSHGCDEAEDLQAVVKGTASKPSPTHDNRRRRTVRDRPSIRDAT
jgi:hypothetical protein